MYIPEKEEKINMDSLKQEIRHALSKTQTWFLITSAITSGVGLLLGFLGYYSHAIPLLIIGMIAGIAYFLYSLIY